MEVSAGDGGETIWQNTRHQVAKLPTKNTDAKLMGTETVGSWQQKEGNGNAIEQKETKEYRVRKHSEEGIPPRITPRTRIKTNGLTVFNQCPRCYPWWK
jgi:hypothetical protein